ncbi:MAG: DnaJ domain-containing protein [Alphaproteobacteria bacterium]|nr:DnaJ domain-containing protein [Alphaproteobacteria bacterium]
MIDYYQILGINYQATQVVIKSAYRKAAQKFHPDRNRNSKISEEKFKLINEAYEVLSNAEIRKEYDFFYFQNLDFSERYKQSTLGISEESLPDYVKGIINRGKLKTINQKLNELYLKNWIVDRNSYRASALVEFEGLSTQRPKYVSIEKEINFFLTARSRSLKELIESNVNPLDEILEEFVTINQDDLLEKYSFKSRNFSEKDKWKSRFRLYCLSDFIDWNSPENNKILLLEYEALVIKYMEFKLSKTKTKTNMDFLSTMKELNRNLKVSGIGNVDKVAYWQMLNKSFIPKDHPDFKTWSSNLETDLKLQIFDEIEEMVLPLSGNISGNFQTVLVQITGAIYINQKMRLMARNDVEKEKAEKIEDKVHNNIETFLLNSKDDIKVGSKNSPSTWQEDILDLLEFDNEDIQKDQRVLNRIKSIRAKLGNTEKEGCYIATACYGSYASPEVLTLRKYRDEVLKKKLFGRAFIRIYYLVSPQIVKLIGNNEYVNNFNRKILDRLIHKLK